MLSTGAFNALLKTLEEPPAHVKFILATTEPQKLPATILSRCQRFDFKKISDENIKKRLIYICDESKIEITPEALKLIAILSEGAMRDALSILERCLQDGEDKIDEEKIKDLVGIPKITTINKIVKSVIEYNINDAIQTVNQIIDEGKDLNNILWEIIKYVKDILVYKVTGNLQIYSEDEIKQIKELAEKIDKERLLYIIYDLSELENDMRWSSQKSVLFQVEIIKLCSKIDYRVNVNNVENTPPKPNKTVNKIENKPEDKKIPKAQPNNGQQVVNKAATKPAGGIENWGNIINNFKQQGKILLYTNLLNSNAIEINDMTVGISFPNGLTPFGKAILEKPENINELSKAISIECGKEMRVKILDKQEENMSKSESDSIENMINDLDIPINIIDE